MRRHRIGFVFQFFHLVPRLTAAENVELPMVFAGIPAAERRERAGGRSRRRARAARRPPARPALGRRAPAGGDRARHGDGPALLLADEPTGNLDTASGRQVLELLERMNGAGLTLVVVTHDPAVARRARRVMGWWTAGSSAAATGRHRRSGRGPLRGGNGA